MDRWACLNAKCRLDGKKFVFEGLPTCPQCGVSMSDPYYGKSTIIKVALIHYHLPSPVPGVGSMMRACDGKSPLPYREGSGEVSTGNTSLVSCQNCKKHPVFLEHTKNFHGFEQDARTESMAKKLEQQRKKG